MYVYMKLHKYTYMLYIRIILISTATNMCIFTSNNVLKMLENSVTRYYSRQRGGQIRKVLTN